MSTSPPQDANASTLTKRSSGRVRKQPDYTSSPFGSGKRKRSNEQDTDGDGGREIPEDYESEELDEDMDEDEPDEEEVREQKKKARKPKSTAPKKPAQKKPKVNGTSLPFRSATGNTRRRPPKKVKTLNVTDAQTAGGLFAEVFASGNTLADVAGTWLKEFDQHESGALAEVVNFVLRCAGCEGEVSAHDIEDPDGVTNKLDDLRDEYQASNPTDYPLIAKGKAATSFRQGVTGFFHALVKAIAASDVLYTESLLMENVQIWVSTMSSAPNRSFRHTATVVSLSIVTALCEVARENAEEIANNQRHAETERKKAKPNKGRVKQLEQKVKDKTEALEFVEPLLKDWFDVVFIHRYRDVDPVIRRDCMVALGDWIVTMPDVFFDGQHLRYLGWVLSDTSAATRGEVLKQLHRFYKEKDMLGGLKTFTEKFRARLVEIATADAETNVRASGIELLNRLRENGLLEPDDIDAVGRLVFDTDPKVRKAVAPFFAENVNDLYSSKIDDLGGLESLQETMPETGEGNYEAPRLEWLSFKSLAEMLQSYDMDENLPSEVERSRGDGSLTLHLGVGDSRFTLAADVLYEEVDVVQQWQVLAGYLLFDHSGRANGVADDPLSQLKRESILSEREETILLEVLNASVKHSLTVAAEKLSSTKSKLMKKAKEQLQDDQEEAARHLADLVPKLLKKFGDVPSTAAAVLRLEAVLTSPTLQDLCQGADTYSALLDDVKKQFMSHGTDEVLAPASDAILRAKSHRDSDELTEEKVTALWEELIGNLAQLLDPDTVTVRGATSFEELTALSDNLLRIVRLAQVSDCIPPLEDSSLVSTNNTTAGEYQGAIDYIIALVQRAKPASGPAPDRDEAALEDEIAGRAAEAALIYCYWKLKTIIEAITTSSGTGISLDELEAPATRRDTYVANLESALQTRKAGEDISIRLTGCVLELYASAKMLKDIKAKPGMSDDYIVLARDLTVDLQKSIMQTFAGAEKNFAKLSGKKLESTTVNGADADVNQDAVDEDPISDPESDDEDDENEPTQTQASQQRHEAKMMSTLRAEQNLCALTGKIVHALAAEVMDDGAVRKRLERNKARLGSNFKAVLEYLDINAVVKQTKGGKGRAKKGGKGQLAAVNGVNRKGKGSAKSNAIVAESEVEDEIEDADVEDEEALRRRELVDDDEREPELGEEVAIGADADADVESVLGD